MIDISQICLQSTILKIPFVLNDEISVNRASKKIKWIELRENTRIAREILE